MLSGQLRIALTKLAMEGVPGSHQSAANPIAGLGRPIAFFNPMRDQLITPLPSFLPAVAALNAEPLIVERMGPDVGARLALQFVYSTWPHLAGGNLESAIAMVWDAFSREMALPNWRFAYLANLQNFDYAGDIAQLGAGVSIQGRSFERIGRNLGWSSIELERLGEDWSAGGGSSSFILLVETQQPKTPDNFLTVNDVDGYNLAMQAMLALRLAGPGDIRAGRLFASRYGAFNVGVMGPIYMGMTLWNPGDRYRLSDATIPTVQSTLALLSEVAGRLNTDAKRVGLALRRFTSTYDRLLHQGEDRIIDAITALEALWGINEELSFRLAFRTASLLASSDDARVHLFRTLKKYYSLRSKIVHGNPTPKDAATIADMEPLRAIVRSALLAFLHLVAHSGEWTLSRLEAETDDALLHGEVRGRLQKAMGIPSGT